MSTCNLSMYTQYLHRCRMLRESTRYHSKLHIEGRMYFKKFATGDYVWSLEVATTASHELVPVLVEVR